MTDPTALDYATLAIALVGAVTGLAALAAQIWSVVLSGPRVRVEVAESFAPGEEGWFLSLEVLNVGRMPVTLADFGIAFGSNKIPVGLMIGASVVRQGPAPGPYRLVDGESVSWVLRSRPLAATVATKGGRRVRGYARLATGKTVTGSRAVDILNLAKFE